MSKRYGRQQKRKARLNAIELDYCKGRISELTAIAEEVLTLPIDEPKIGDRTVIVGDQLISLNALRSGGWR